MHIATHKNVYVMDIDKPYQFSRKEKSDYLPAVTEEERQRIVQYMFGKSESFFNGDVVRLNSVEENGGFLFFSVSPLTYFDSLVTNQLYNKYSGKTDCLAGSSTEKLILKTIEGIQQAGISDFQSVLSNNHLANTIGISCLIKDSLGRYGLVQRNQKVTLGKGFTSVTVTGAVDSRDYRADDPIKSCAMREAKEELDITLFEMRVKALAISTSKLQPIFLVNAIINETWEHVLDSFRNTAGFLNENNSFYICTSDDLKNVLKFEKMTDAARYHIMTTLESDNASM